MAKALLWPRRAAFRSGFALSMADAGMRRAIVLLALLILSGCTAPQGEPVPSTAPTMPSPTAPGPSPPPSATPSPSSATPPPPEPAPATPTPPAAATTTTVTFELEAPGHEEMELRFPVFWGPTRGQSLRMTREGDTFRASAQLPPGALIRYEYSDPALDYEHREQFARGQGVNRHLVVTPQATIRDSPYAFDNVDTARTVSLAGRVTDAATGAPVPEAFVVADGIMVGTIDGYYEVPVRDRAFDVTVFTADGSYRALTRRVDAGIADFALDAAPKVRVRVEANATTPPHHALRMFTTAAQVTPQYFFNNALTAEVHTTLPNGTLDLELREGQWVDYLYTVGNTVHSYEQRDGAWVIRGFAAKDGLVVRDDIGSFLREGTVWFNVTVPAYTGQDDVVRIARLDPRILAMHPAGDHRWTLAASGGDIQGAKYRYAKTWAGAGDELTLERVVLGFHQEDVVTEWKLQDAPSTWTSAEAVPEVKNPYRVVVTLPDWYSHAHALALPAWLRNISEQGYHGVVLNSVWGYAPLEPEPRIARSGPTFALHMPAAEVWRATRLAHDAGLVVEMEQQLVGAEALLSSERQLDETWWRAWLVQIERFNLQTARVAQEAGLDSVVLVAAQPGMSYPASFTAEYNAGMTRVIAQMREVYDGEIVAPYDEFRQGPLDYWRSADRITQVTYDLRMPADASQAQVDAWVANLLDTRYKPQSDAAGLKTTIKFGVQSTRGALAGATVPEAQGPATEQNEQVLPLGHEDQLKAYSAFFRAANDRPWLAEMNVWVYGPTDAPQTRDVDVRGKPAGALAAGWARAITAAPPS